MTDGEARQILSKYNRLLIKLANRASLKIRYFAASSDFDDMLAIAKHSCLQAVKVFDPTHGTPEQAWVARLVRQALQKEINEAKTMGFRMVGEDQPVCVPGEDRLFAPDPPSEYVQWFRSCPERILTKKELKVLRGILAGETEGDIGSALDVSKQRIDQMKNQIIAKLKRSARLTFQPA